jgi:hypothetical protein
MEDVEDLERMFFALVDNPEVNNIVSDKEPAEAIICLRPAYPSL